MGRGRVEIGRSGEVMEVERIGGEGGRPVGVWRRGGLGFILWVWAWMLMRTWVGRNSRWRACAVR